MRENSLPENYTLFGRMSKNNNFVGYFFARTLK